MVSPLAKPRGTGSDRQPPGAAGRGRFRRCQPYHGGKGIKELRFFIGPGYRVYFKQYGAALVVLLCGGDKDSQSRDIEAAKRLAAEYEDNDDG